MTEDYPGVILNVESNYYGNNTVNRTVEHLDLIVDIFICANLFTAIFIHSRLDIYLSEDPLCRVIHSAVNKNIYISMLHLEIFHLYICSTHNTKRPSQIIMERIWYN